MALPVDAYVPGDYVPYEAAKIEVHRRVAGAREVAELIMLREDDELVVAASAGHAADAGGRRLLIAGSSSGDVLRRGRPERVTDVASQLRIAPEQLGVLDAHTALLVPMLHQGAALGVLAAFDRGRDGDAFTGADEQLLRTFAASAANAVAIRRSVASPEADTTSQLPVRISCTASSEVPNSLTVALQPVAVSKG